MMHSFTGFVPTQWSGKRAHAFTHRFRACARHVPYRSTPTLAMGERLSGCAVGIDLGTTNSAIAVRFNLEGRHRR